MMLRKKILSMLCLILLTYSSLVFSMASWDESDDPDIIQQEDSNYTYEYNFYRLPTQGKISHLPWTDSYWPHNRRGLAYRYATKRSAERFYSLSEVKKMSLQQLATLSPAEKYDIYMGRFDYPLTNEEFERTSYDSPEWEGICNGWAPASLAFKEPKPVTLVGANGIQVPFGSSDIKGLLSLFIAEKSGQSSYFVGTRGYKTFRIFRSNVVPDFLNAGAFHVIMTNRIGKQDKGFVIDVDNGLEVWNQPVHAFKTRILREQAPSYNYAYGTVKEILVSSEVVYTDEIEPEFKARNIDGNESFRKTKKYDYILELDRNGNILGGKWTSSEYPGFLWSMSAGVFSGYMKDLKDIYRASIR
ncbi:MAG: hypothetical protein HQK49_02185 [Oligoflexia bacterium]|nr:hypothetical protein [Oligoflexia bacterium]